MNPVFLVFFSCNPSEAGRPSAARPSRGTTGRPPRGTAECPSSRTSPQGDGRMTPQRDGRTSLQRDRRTSPQRDSGNGMDRRPPGGDARPAACFYSLWLLLVGSSLLSCGRQKQKQPEKHRVTEIRRQTREQRKRRRSAGRPCWLPAGRGRRDFLSGVLDRF